MITREAILNKDILLDTGVLNNVFKPTRPEREERFWQSLEQWNFASTPKAYFISTVFMMFECLGISKNELQPLIVDRSLAKKVETSLRGMNLSMPEVAYQEALTCMVDWYKRSDNYQKDYLLQRCRQESTRRTYRGGLFYHGLFEKNILAADFDNQVFPRLSFAALQRLKIDEIGLSDQQVFALEKALLQTYRSMLLDDYHGYNFAFSGDYISIRAAEKLGKKLPSAYEDAGEALDTEIVHFVSCGSSQSGKHNSVAVFTTERLSKWKSRLERYYAFINYLTEDKGLLIYPGSIYQVDQNTGTIKESFNVADHFRGDLGSLKIKQDTFLDR